MTRNGQRRSSPSRTTSPVTSSGEVPPLRQRSPGLYWIAVVLVVALLVSLIAGGLAVLVP